MNWWKPRYSVCSECQVHFEPWDDRETRYGHTELCKTHRDPVLRREDRMRKVLDWAKVNWEKLEPQALEEEHRLRSMQARGLGAVLAAHQQQAAAAANFPLSHLRGIFG